MRGNRDVKYGVAVPAQAVVDTTPVNGSGIDTLGYEIAEFLVNVGTPSSADTISVKVQDAVEDPATPGTALSSDWGDLSGGNIDAIAAAAGKVIQVATRSAKRFLRLVVTAAGSSISIPIGASYALRGGKASLPETVADKVVGFA